MINFGNNDPVELKHVIELIETAVENKSKVRFDARQSAEVIATWANIRRAQEILHWMPRTSIAMGIEQTVRRFVSNRALIESLRP